MTYVGNAQEDAIFINWKKNINHLMYIDEIKLFAEYEKRIENPNTRNEEIHSW